MVINQNQKGDIIMDLRSEILAMYYDENLTIGEIAGALRQDPKYIYSIVFYKKWFKKSLTKALFSLFFAKFSIHIMRELMV